MQIKITSFNNVRYFTENIIPISTAASVGWPWWLYKSDNQKLGDYYVNQNNVMIGIKEDAFSAGDFYDKLTEQCQKNCPYRIKAPHCQFMEAYYEHLNTFDFSKLLNEFNRIAEDVRKITQFKGEPIIVLLVYEAASCICAERPVLQRWFKDNGYELNEWELTDSNIF